MQESLQMHVEVPWKEIEADALRGLIEEFVTRDGTDYGWVETSLEAKVEQVLGQLKSGKAVVTFDTEVESATIVVKDR